MADTLKKSVVIDERQFPALLGASGGRQREPPRRYTQKRSRNPPDRFTTLEPAKAIQNAFSRGFRSGSVFDFFNSIGAKRTFVSSIFHNNRWTKSLLVCATESNPFSAVLTVGLMAIGPILRPAN
jgi:hypothetical protein